MNDEFLKGLLLRLNDATKPVDAGDRNLIIRALTSAPSTPAAFWRDRGEADPHGKQYECERYALTLGNLTDDELANGAFMNYDTRLSVEDMINPKPGQYRPIVWMTAVKERIRWLSRALDNVMEKT